MPAITITPELALAAGKDAANARARKAGRKRWNRDDAVLAAETTGKLMDLLHSGHPNTKGAS